MSLVQVNDGTVILHSSDKIFTITDFESESVKQFKPDLEEKSLENEGQQNGNTEKPKNNKDQKEDSIYSACLSNCRQFIAIATEKKQLLIFHKEKLVSRTALSRKASKLTFTHSDAGKLVLADKNGDVYSVDIGENCGEPKLVLGHLSMLLDVCLTSDNRFILTADRDEKVRVSHFPNSYNIKTFCLGHTDFVTSISLLDDSLLVSGSGDGTVRIWRFLEGEQLQMHHVSKDVNLPEKQNVEKQMENMIVDPKRSQPSETPAVIKVKAFNNKSNLFLVQMEGLDGCILYSYSAETNSIQLQQIIRCDHALLDFSIDAVNSDVVLLTHTKEEASNFVLLRYKQEGSKLSEPEAFKQIPSEILACVGDSNAGGDLETLHKRWFDNMKDYLERKQIRIEQSKAKSLALKESSEAPNKKQKIAA